MSVSWQLASICETSVKATCPEPVPSREPQLPVCPYLAATVRPGLHQRGGGAQLNGLRLVEDDGWERFLLQCEDIQFRLQHGLEVLKSKSRSQR